MKKSKVFVTGATGYVGHQLAKKLADEDYEVVALVRDVDSEKIPVHKNILPVKGDLCDFHSIESAIDGCTYAFHTAAFTNLKCNRVDSFYNTNVRGTENVLKAAQQTNVKKVIYSSTLSVFGPSYKDVPITESQPRLEAYANDYELTKSMAEELVLDYERKGLPSVILNLSRVYGPGLKTYSNGVNRLVNMIAENDFLIVPSKLDVVANYVYIDDVVDAHLLAVDKGKSGEKYIIGGENASYNQLFKKIKSLTKSKIKILKVNYNMVKGALMLFYKLNGVFEFGASVTPKVLDSLFTNRGASCNKAISQLEYRITPFDLGLERTINFLSK
ncbi:NAD-dependent epimerase/dehydratase family protein [Tamlana flava]|uniref:NAD-dependent epimerase/dehydratase family protein n=1 Tax=Tamlana flava TaxID=3158572 RepID=UPI00351B13E3